MAADQGFAGAQFGLGFMYAEGRGVQRDDVEAVRWYRMAADQGFAGAQYALGVMYNTGRGVKQDYAEAIRWWRKAADQGETEAQFNLAVMYKTGRGVSQDNLETLVWLNLAASGATGDDKKAYAEARDSFAKKLHPQQIAEAQRRAREWKPPVK
jgi:TPR repeat protein